MEAKLNAINPNDLKKLTFKQYVKKDWKWIIFSWSFVPFILAIYYLIGSDWWVYFLYPSIITPLNLFMLRASYHNEQRRYKLLQIQTILEARPT